jgi:hypothetical protein
LVSSPIWKLEVQENVNGTHSPLPLIWHFRELSIRAMQVFTLWLSNPPNQHIIHWSSDDNDSLWPMVQLHRLVAKTLQYEFINP